MSHEMKSGGVGEEWTKMGWIYPAPNSGCVVVVRWVRMGFGCGGWMKCGEVVRW